MWVELNMKKVANKLSSEQVSEFRRLIWDYYTRCGRIFPWRNNNDPYKIVISEVMLQQTQTYRVLPKYEQFIATFPSFSFLAQATLREVLSVWQGLGYNRRGKYVHELAQRVMNEFEGVLPSSVALLVTLPGIGPATAASICAFAFNAPTLFIETNIRTVFIHCFFGDKEKINDKEIMPLVAQTLDHENPREWYYALMDYGVMLKQATVNPSRKSIHYARQTKFQGSDRQLRGKIIRLLTDAKEIAVADLGLRFPGQEHRLETIVNGLLRDGLVRKKGSFLVI